MKIIAIGRNYVAHAKELQNEVPTEPVIFQKPETALLRTGSDFYHPEFSKDIHYECELVIKINKEGKHIAKQFAHKYYDEVSLGIDFTARDIQNNLKTKGLPWELAKAFDNSAVVGHFIPKPDNIQDVKFSFTQNEVIKQNGHTANMIFDVDTIISFVSSYFTLKKGDLIFTGTPEGVGKISIGDTLQGFINTEEIFKVQIK